MSRKKGGEETGTRARVGLDHGTKVAAGIERASSLTDEQIARAVVAERGNLKAAAALVGVSRSCLSARVARTPMLADLLRDEREGLLDDLERLVEDSALVDVENAKWVLKTRGKHRGWSERQEVTGADGGPIEIAGARDRLRELLGRR